MVQLRSLSQTNNAIFATNLVLRVELTPLEIKSLPNTTTPVVNIIKAL